MTAVLSEFEVGDRASTLEIEGLVLRLAATVVREREHSSGSSAWVEDVRERLRAEFQSPASLDDLAAEAGVHPGHLTRTFRARFGCSIGTYVRRLRVSAVLRAIADPDRSLADLASEAGFSDQSHMGRVVRRETGLTPGEWRARGRR